MIFMAYLDDQISRDSAVARIGVSNRQFIRLQNRFLTDKNLQHKLCNRDSNHSIDAATKARVIELYKTKYRGWNYEHIHDSLLSRDGIDVSPDTIRNWLLAAKLSLPKQRKPRKYMRREPKAQFNEMLQLDGTFGDFLGDGRMLCLMHLVDDATKTSLAMLFEAECTDSALRILYHWCLKYGVPQSIYSDRHSTYKVNEKQKLTIAEELEGSKIPLSEFGKVCDRLEIRQIFAHSPQAKGRVEKKHQLYKDRWIKELKLDGIKTIEEANNASAETNCTKKQVLELPSHLEF
jgi:transposase